TPALPTLAQTARRDAWWAAPVATAGALTAFGAYAVFAAVEGKDYLYTRGGARYLSPFYSPDLHAMFGLHLPFSFAFLVLWAPLGLRLTCYYYRKAYYRSFFWSPPACAIPDAPRRYSGETRFPFLLQNLHRYFFWLALVVVLFLWWDALRAFVFPTALGMRFGIGLGTLVLVANAALLSLYSLSCHSCRHICGGGLDSFRGSPLRYRFSRWVS